MRVIILSISVHQSIKKFNSHKKFGRDSDRVELLLYIFQWWKKNENKYYIVGEDIRSQVSSFIITGKLFICSQFYFLDLLIGLITVTYRLLWKWKIHVKHLPSIENIVCIQQISNFFHWTITHGMLIPKTKHKLSIKLNTNISVVNFKVICKPGTNISLSYNLLLHFNLSLLFFMYFVF